MAYFDWHQKPTYYNDVARHFDPERSLLDLGCGLGWMADHVQEYVGLDASPEAVESAKGRGRDVRLGSLDDPLPFGGETFDAVLLKDVLEHVGNVVAVVKEVRRVLRPGGRVFATSPDAQRWVWNDYTHVRPFTRKAFRQLFSDQGFEVIDHSDSRPRQESGGGIGSGEPAGDDRIYGLLHLCDVISVMTVNPGFGGQAFLPEMLPKIRRIRAICAERGLHPIIEVDGGENATTAAQVAAAGATAIVAGSAIFGTSDYKSAIAAIRASVVAAEVEP